MLGGRRCIRRDRTEAAGGEASERAAADGSRQKRTEPVALSSTVLVGFPLPRTTSESGFVLLALRARCRSESTDRVEPVQGGWGPKTVLFARNNPSTFPHLPCRIVGKRGTLMRGPDC